MGLRRDVFQKETFFDRAIEMGMRIVGFVFHHPIAVLSLLILYVLVAELIGGAKGWREK